MSKKIGTKASASGLALLIKMDRITLWDFMRQAKIALAWQKKFIAMAAKDNQPEAAERWMENALREPAVESGDFGVLAGGRKIKYVKKPKGGNRLLCQTKRYKNEMRSQEARYLSLKKTIESLRE